MSVSTVSTESVVASYVAMKPSARVLFMSGLTARFGAALTTMNNGSAKESDKTEALATISNVYEVRSACEAATAKQGKVAVEVDYVTVVSQRILDLRTAANMLEAGLATPDSIEQVNLSDLSATVNSRTLLPSDEAVRIATAKLTRREDRHSIQAVFDRAFDGLDEGSFLTTTEIAQRGAVEGYAPGTGAIGARLQPRSGKDCTLVGYEVTPATANQPLGATKIEE